MASKKLRPSPDLLFQLESTFLANGYRALTMEKLAESCNFSRRALHFYFGSKAEAFRAAILFRNEVALSTSFAAGQRLGLMATMRSRSWPRSSTSAMAIPAVSPMPHRTSSN